RPVGGEIDERGEHPAMRIAALGIDHPFVAPLRGELDAVVVHGLDLDAEPAVIGAAVDQLLHAFDSDLVGHSNHPLVGWAKAAEVSAGWHDVRAAVPTRSCQRPRGHGGAGLMRHTKSRAAFAHPATLCLYHGATTTFPITSRSRISRRPSRASSSGSTLSITGFILPSWMSRISPLRSSS